MSSGTSRERAAHEDTASLEILGAFLAVDGIDLDIEEGAFVAIMGPSGCGKTTTLRMIAGLEVPDRGSIHYRGSDVTYASPWDRRMPLVWQNLALFPFLNVIENVAFGLRMANVPKSSGASERNNGLTAWAWPSFPAAMLRTCRAASSSGWLWREHW